MTRRDWPVLAEGLRPAGPPDRCFYCDAPIGGQHGPECVVRERTVVVEARVTYVISVPESWDAGAIEFSRNESSSCADRLVPELDRLTAEPEVDAEGVRPSSGCLCGRVEWRYVREATAEDEARDGLRVEDLPT